MRHDFIVTREESLLLIIDLQTDMLKAVAGGEQSVKCTRQLVLAAQVLDIPVLITEQYKKGLGDTHPDVLDNIDHPKIVAKEHFSACLEPEFLARLRSLNRQKLVVAGTETHVCVLQTCLDLLQASYQVHLAADAVGSRKVENRDIAISQLRQAGAVISSTEIVIFEWTKRANTEKFRRILPIVK